MSVALRLSNNVGRAGNADLDRFAVTAAAVVTLYPNGERSSNIVAAEFPMHNDGILILTSGVQSACIQE